VTSNPNAIAAFVAGAFVAGVQWLVGRYAHLQVSKYWSDALTVAVTTVVLFVGRDGVKGALVRVWAGAKSSWTGTTPTPPAAAK
jgi:hypothetical protein